MQVIEQSGLWWRRWSSGVGLRMRQSSVSTLRSMAVIAVGVWAQDVWAQDVYDPTTALKGARFGAAISMPNLATDKYWSDRLNNNYETEFRVTCDADGVTYKNPVGPVFCDGQFSVFDPTVKENGNPVTPSEFWSNPIPATKTETDMGNCEFFQKVMKDPSTWRWYNHFNLTKSGSRLSYERHGTWDACRGVGQDGERPSDTDAKRCSRSIVCYTTSTFMLRIMCARAVMQDMGWWPRRPGMAVAAPAEHFRDRPPSAAPARHLNRRTPP